MRFSTVVTLVGAATLASASILFPRQVSDYPSCAVSCFESTSLGSCSSLTDYQCLCNNQAFITTSTECMYKACSGTDLIKAAEIARQVCASIGITITSGSPTTTTAVSFSTSKASGSGSGSGSSSGSGSGSGNNGAGFVKSGASKTSRNAILGLAVAALTAFCL